MSRFKPEDESNKPNVKEHPAETSSKNTPLHTFPGLVPESKTSPLPVNISPFMDVNLKVSVILGETKMSMGELLKLGSGSIIELNNATGDPIDILINDTLYAKGEVVVVDECFGVKIVEIVNPQKGNG